MDNRYNQEYTHGSVVFYLSDCMPDMEQCRFLILKVLEQAVRDYCSLSGSELPNEQLIYHQAKEFLYNDQYYLMWGGLELTTEELLQLVDLDISWVREQTTRKSKARK
jgi:hypothetical protein